MEKNIISLQQGYKAMYSFVRAYYYRTGKPSDIANLLSDMQLLSEFYNDPKRESVGENLNTMDPASWEDWLEAIESVLREEGEKKGV